MEQDAAEMITAYYEALEASEPLSPFFAESLSTVKVGLSEQLVGYPDVADALAEQTATTVVLRIADNGPGVPDSEKEAVFEKGRKGAESPGSGIGLYLVSKLVDQYNGEIWVEDNEPKGAVFALELPIYDPEMD